MLNLLFSNLDLIVLVVVVSPIWRSERRSAGPPRTGRHRGQLRVRLLLPAGGQQVVAAAPGARCPSTRKGRVQFGTSPFFLNINNDHKYIYYSLLGDF